MNNERLTREQQFSGLLKLSKFAGEKYRVIAAVKQDEGDVACCFAHHPEEGSGRIEICFADGTYDVWENGNLTSPNVALADAAKRIAADYCALKARTIAKRWLKENKGQDAALVYRAALETCLEHHMKPN